MGFAIMLVYTVLTTCYVSARASCFRRSSLLPHASAQRLANYLLCFRQSILLSLELLAFTRELRKKSTNFHRITLPSLMPEPPLFALLIIVSSTIRVSFGYCAIFVVCFFIRARLLA